MLEIVNAISIIGFSAPLKAQNSLSYRSGSSGKCLHACLGGPGMLAATSHPNMSIWVGFLSLSQLLTSLSVFWVAEGWVFSVAYILSIQSSSGVPLFSG